MSIHAFGALRKGRASGGGGSPSLVTGWYSDWATQDNDEAGGQSGSPHNERMLDTVGGVPRWNSFARVNNMVIRPAPTGAPFLNALKDEIYGNGGQAGLYRTDLTWDVDDVLTIRFYMQYVQPGNVGAENNHHGIGNSQGNSTTNWSLNCSYWVADETKWRFAMWNLGGSGDDVYWGPWGAAGRGSQVGNNNFANDVLLDKNHWYRFVVQCWRRSSTTYSNRIWVYDHEDNDSLLLGPSDFCDIGGSNPQSDDPVITCNVTSETINDFVIGANGIGGTYSFPLDFAYFGGVAITNNLTWGTPLGPYGTVTNGTTTEGE